MDSRKKVRPWVAVWPALALWMALVLLFAAQFVWVASFPWRDALQWAVYFWGLWVLLMPGVVLLVVRYPFERHRLWGRLGIHLVACALLVTFSQFVYRELVKHPPPPPGEWPPEFEAGVRNLMLLRDRPPPGFLGLRAGLDSMLYWSLVGACQAMLSFRSSQQRERRAAELEARLTRSKLQALRMQINPHFLFNTLNAISTLIYVNPRSADEMLGDLSELLRRALDTADEQEIPLARELKFIGAYVGIEQKRFGDRLRVERSVPDDVGKALVPTLILQPLVENAIRHGIEPQRAPGVIVIQATREADQLRLVVRDNGKGLAPDPHHGPRRAGIGLANTRARLQALYGDAQQFDFGEDEPRGCRVEIRLPFHTEPLASSLPTTHAL